MYRVILVDDELLVISSLKNRIDWNEQGFEIVGEARNGFAAYEKITELKPDIVFTDIRMAGMTGLDLIQKVNKTDPNILFVVISGYAEFTYAQKALNYGALGFCLKPFDEDEIINILQNAKIRLDKLRNSYEKELLTFIEDFKDEELCYRGEILDKLGFDKDSETKYIIAVSIGTGSLEISKTLKSISMRVGRNKYLYIIESTANEFETCIKKEYALKNKDSDTLIKGIGISKSHDSFSTMRIAFEEANIAACQYFTKYSKHKIFKFRDTQQEAFDAIMKELRNSLVLKDIESIEKQMDLLVNLFEIGNFTIQHAMKVYNAFMYLFEREDGFRQDINLESFEQLTSMFANVNEMFLNLKSMTVRTESTKPIIAEEAVNDTYTRILRYINENFCNEISVQSIAIKLQCNPNYVSQMFKRENGETFTEYLTGVRVKHACTLLKNEELPVYEIAERAGYKDYFHFAKIFKKNTGKTPTEYRDGK